MYKGPYVRYIRKTLIVYGSAVHKKVPGYTKKTLIVYGPFYIRKTLRVFFLKKYSSAIPSYSHNYVG